MSVIINPIITNAGLNVFTPMATGIEFTFTHVAVGTGTSAVNANATALENEIDRFTIAGGGVIAGGKAVSINALVTNHSNANPQDYNISEIGFYGLDGNNNTILFAIHRQSTTIVRKVAGADIAMPFVLGLSALPTENMTVTIDTNTSGALALLGQHVSANHPHTQYKRILDNTERLKIANGTDNDHAVSKGQLDGAISTEAGTRANADTALQTAINGKANTAGSSTQTFSVAAATANDHAVSKGQLDGAISTEAGTRANADTALQTAINGKANTAGSSTQTFSVAAATANDHAVRKDQFDAKTGIATDIVAGIVEKATQQEMNVGLNNVWPDAATIFNGFERSSTPDGYIKLPEWMGGLIIQWGYNSDTVTVEKLITFPIDFPSVCYNVQCTGDETNNAGAEIINVKNVTRLSFTWIGAVGTGAGVSPEAQKGYWLAIGK